MTKQELIAQLEGPASVDFTFMPVSKVLELLKQLEESSEGTQSLSDEEINTIAEEVAEGVASDGLNLISDYQLSMSYREVELDSVDLDEGLIKREVKIALKNIFTERAERTMIM